MVLGELPVPGRPTIWMIVGQGPIVLAVGAGGGCLDIFTLLYLFSSLSPSLWETARYRLKYCLKGPLNPKQPTNQPTVTETLRPKKVLIFNRLSDCDFLFVSTSNVLFFIFLTDFGVPIKLSICFSITKGERDVSPSPPLIERVDWSASSSDSICRILFLLDAMTNVYLFRWLCASPTTEPYKGTFYGNGPPIPNAKATYPLYSTFKSLGLTPIRFWINICNPSLKESI